MSCLSHRRVRLGAKSWSSGHSSCGVHIGILTHPGETAACISHMPTHRPRSGSPDCCISLCMLLSTWHPVPAGKLPRDLCRCGYGYLLSHSGRFAGSPCLQYSKVSVECIGIVCARSERI